MGIPQLHMAIQFKQISKVSPGERLLMIFLINLNKVYIVHKIYLTLELTNLLIDKQSTLII